MMQAEGGLMSITGAADGPPFRLGVAIGDIATGMFAVQGILAALFARERSRRAASASTSRCSTRSRRSSPTRRRARSPPASTPVRMGNRHPSIAPYDTFAAADGEFVLSVGNDDQFRAALRASWAAPALAADPRFATNADRVRHCDALRPSCRRCSRRGRGRICSAALTAAGVPSGAVRSVTEALADPQLAAREMIVPLEHATAGPIRVLGTPLKLSDTPAAVRTPPPTLGQHTVRVLRDDLGLSDADIEALQKSGAIT